MSGRPRDDFTPQLSFTLGEMGSEKFEYGDLDFDPEDMDWGINFKNGVLDAI